MATTSGRGDDRRIRDIHASGHAQAVLLMISSLSRKQCFLPQRQAAVTLDRIDAAAAGLIEDMEDKEQIPDR